MEKIDRHFSEAIECTVELTAEKNPSISKSQHIEVTLVAKGATIRSELSTEDMFKSVDGVIDKLDRQIFSYKGKLYLNKNSHHKETEMKSSKMNAIPSIIKRKNFALNSMSQNEAVLQLELLNLNFYMFQNSDTDEINVIYRRQDGNYGLIEPT